MYGEFPGGSVVKTLPANAGSAGSNPGQEAKILHASLSKNQHMKQKQYCNKFNRDFLKNSPHQKKSCKKKSQRTNLKDKNRQKHRREKKVGNTHTQK